MHEEPPPAEPAIDEPVAARPRFDEIVKRLGPAGALGVAWSTIPALASILVFSYISSIGSWLRGHGWEGIAIYSVVFALTSGFGVMPTYSSAILGGWAFGFALGFPAAQAGYLGGAVIGYGVARLASRDRVTEILHEHPKWQTVRDALVGGSWLKTFSIVSLVRLPPNSPFALTNLVLASVRVRFSAFVAGSIIGMAPRTGLVLYLASRFREGDAGAAVKQQTPWWMYAAGIVLGLVVLGVLGLISRRALERVTSAKSAG
jgi:uncharacterized membrane protein YdjX (TVP38/TMEM64 family)